MNFVKLTTNPSASIAFSSIAPTELYTKVDDSKTDNAKIVVSWVKSESDNEPVPSESIINKFIYYPFDYTLIGYDHTHSPYFILIFLDFYKIYIYINIIFTFVHGLTVGPTPKPSLLFKITLFNR